MNLFAVNIICILWTKTYMCLKARMAGPSQYHLLENSFVCIRWVCIRSETFIFLALFIASCNNNYTAILHRFVELLNAFGMNKGDTCRIGRSQGSPYNPPTPPTATWKGQRKLGERTQKSCSQGNICLSNGKTFPISPTHFSDKSSFPLQHLKCVIFYDVWVSHAPLLYASSSFFITVCSRSVLFSLALQDVCSFLCVW